MTGNTVKKKIANTRLFSDAEKIELLVRLEELSESDRKVLEQTVDGFDVTYAASSSILKDDIDKGFSALNQDLSDEEKGQTEEAKVAIQLGLGLLK